MTKQVMSILSATDKKIKTLYPAKVAARKAAEEADKMIKEATEGEVKEEPKPLKLNRRTRRHLRKMSRKMRKAEVRANNQKRYEEKLEAKNE